MGDYVVWVFLSFGGFLILRVSSFEFKLLSCCRLFFVKLVIN